MMRASLPALFTAIIAVFICGCGSHGDRIPGAPVPTLPIKITQESIDSSHVPPAVTWIATYDSGGVSATFGIVLFMREVPRDSAYVLTQGYLLRRETSDGSVFLRDLASTLGAGAAAAAGANTRANTLPIDAAITGVGLSRNRGYFTLQPRGNWICLKIFLAQGKGEFFLNVDPVAGVGEIVRTAPQYGAAVVRELSRIVQ